MVLIICKSADRAREWGVAFGDYAPALTLEMGKRLARAARFRVIVLDVFAGDSEHSAIEALPFLSTRAPVVIMTTRLDAPTVDQAISLGAAGAVERDAYDIAGRVNDAVDGWRQEMELVASGRLSRALH